MKKISVDISTSFCPQALFLYGTYKENGGPNFGLFCWISYCSNDGLYVMASIGGEKLTKGRIHENGVFSANLVSRSMLPVADYFGNIGGCNQLKMAVPVEVVPGSVLNVPILKNSPWSYELGVEQTIKLSGSEVYICKVHNVMAFDELIDESNSVSERMRLADPVVSVGRELERYFVLNTDDIGSWGEWAETFKKK